MAKEARAKRIAIIGTGGAPIPHFPNWMYLCPDCGQNWESPLLRTQYVVPCPDCFKKAQEAKHD